MTNEQASAQKHQRQQQFNFSQQQQQQPQPLQQHQMHYTGMMSDVPIEMNMCSGITKVNPFAYCNTANVSAPLYQQDEYADQQRQPQPRFAHMFTPDPSPGKFGMQAPYMPSLDSRTVPPGDPGD